MKPNRDQAALAKSSFDFNFRLLHVCQEYPYETPPQPECYERDVIYFVANGKIAFETNGLERVLSDGDVFAAFSNISFRKKGLNPEAEFLCLAFEGPDADEILRRCGFGLDMPVRHLGEKESAEARILIEDAFHQLQGSHFRDLTCAYRDVFSLFALLENDNMEPLNSFQGWTTQCLDQACAYIQANYQKPITIGDVAKSLSISHSYLSKLFKARYGKSVKSYLYDCRIDKAKTLLAETNVPITEIAKLVGYEEEIVFSRAFKNKALYSPRAYRQVMKNGKED